MSFFKRREGPLIGRISIRNIESTVHMKNIRHLSYSYDHDTLFPVIHLNTVFRYRILNTF
jgi:hypothetical protein